MNPCRSSTLWVLLVVALLPLAGCGKAEYERRVLAGMGGMVGGGALGPPVKIPGTDLSIRLPGLIDATSKAYNETSPEPVGANPVNPARLNPPFLKIPGLRVCYEKQLVDDATGTNLPMFWYVGAQAAADPLPDGKPIEQYAMDTLTAAFPPPAPQPVADTANAGVVPWKRVTYKGNQTFIGLEGNNRTEGGTFQMMIGEVNNMRVVVAFRVPNKFLTSTNAIDVLATVAASIKLDEPAEGAAAAPAAPAQ